MAYFVQQPDPNDPDKMIFVEVAADAIDIPDDVLAKKVVAHPKYREVLDESKSRKEKLKALRDQLAQLEGQGEEGAAPAQPIVSGQSPVEPVKPLDEEELYKKFRQRLAADQKAETEAQKAERQRLEKIAEKHGLGADALPLLQNANDPEATAALLEKSNYRFDEVSGGAPAEPDKDAVLGNVLDRLGLSDKKK